jgi:hypothetical protein
VTRDLTEPDLLAEAALALSRMPAAEWRGYLADLRTRAVDEGRADVYTFAAQTLQRLRADGEGRR